MMCHCKYKFWANVDPTAQCPSPLDTDSEDQTKLHVASPPCMWARGRPVEIKSFLRWIVNDVTGTICDLNKHSVLLDQFLLAVIEIWVVQAGRLW